MKGSGERGESVGTQQKEHRVGGPIKRKVCPVLGTGLGLKPGQGEATPGFVHRLGCAVGGMAEKGRALYRGGKTGRGGVDVGRGAQYSDIGEPSFVGQE